MSASIPATTITHRAALHHNFLDAGDGAVDFSMETPDGADGVLRAVIFSCDVVTTQTITVTVGTAADADQYFRWVIPAATAAEDTLTEFDGLSRAGPMIDRNIPAGEDVVVAASLASDDGTNDTATGSLFVVIDWHLPMTRPRSR